MERARFPERFIVGCANPELPLPVALSSFLASFSCPVLPMRYESAELAKISINMCLVASVGVANTMAEVCEKTGADWAEIVPALKLDRRIGAYSYLSPGLGIAGGNLERDLATVLSLSKLHGTDAGIVAAWVENSAHRKDWAWSVLNNLVLNEQPHAKIAVLCLAYKEDTHSTKNSPSLALLARLNNYSVVVYDPVVAVETTGLDLMAAASAIDAIQDADVVCIMTPWAEFKKMSMTDLSERMRGLWVLDPYRVLDGNAVESVGLRYVTLGVAPREVC
jgi:UDPglucose 6-dehydrogenase